MDTRARAVQAQPTPPNAGTKHVDGGLIPRPEQVEHPPKLGAIPFGPGRLLAKDVAVVHARLRQRLQLKRPVLIRGGDAGVAEPASHRAKTSVRNVSVLARGFCTSSAF